MRAFSLAAAVLAAVLVGGCDSDEKKPDDAAAPARSTTQPAAAARDDDPGIVIKGSKRTDAEKPREPDEQVLRRRAELEEAARSSQGKGEGGTAAPDAGSASVTALRRKQLKLQIADDDAKMARLKDEKKALETTRPNPRTHVIEKVYTDPERAVAIDQETAALQADKKQAQADLAALPADTAQPPRSGAPAPKNDPPKTEASAVAWGSSFKA